MRFVELNIWETGSGRSCIMTIRSFRSLSTPILVHRVSDTLHKLDNQFLRSPPNGFPLRRFERPVSQAHSNVRKPSPKLLAPFAAPFATPLQALQLADQ